VIYMDYEGGRTGHTDSLCASRILFEMAGVRTRKFDQSRSSITLDFNLTTNDDDHNNGNGPKPTTFDTHNPGMEFRELLLSEAGYDPLTPLVMKRQGYLSWDDYFTAVAFLSAQRSKDPNTQVGACIVDSNMSIIGIGYNGFPRVSAKVSIS